MVGGLLGGNVPETGHVDDEALAIVVVIISTCRKPLVFASARIVGAQLAFLPVCLPGVLDQSVPRRQPPPVRSSGTSPCAGGAGTGNPGLPLRFGAGAGAAGGAAGAAGAPKRGSPLRSAQALYRAMSAGRGLTGIPG